MRAVICPRGGPPEVLELREVEKPPPGPKEILIRIHASTVTSGDVILRKVRGPVRWVFSLAFGLGKNPITGHELSGDIEKVGSEVMSFQAGEAVFASTGNKGGANAEFICLPEDGMIATKPANLNYEQAAAVPVGANTALVILREGAIKAGMKVLVYGASGSVGTYAVQLALDGRWRLSERQVLNQGEAGGSGRLEGAARSRCDPAGDRPHLWAGGHRGSAPLCRARA
ncbi:MAG: NAD(P)-dependent alcohol dehydrogenase [Anaerolineales bacterium]